MIGAFTVGKKAVQFGYKRYGVPGAIAAGGVTLAGYVIVRRALRSAADSDDVDSAIDTETIKSAVEETGLKAVTDPGTLEDAIDEEQLASAGGVDEIKESVSSTTDEFDVEQDPDESNDES